MMKKKKKKTRSRLDLLDLELVNLTNRLAGCWI